MLRSSLSLGELVTAMSGPSMGALQNPDCGGEILVQKVVFSRLRLQEQKISQHREDRCCPLTLEYRRG